LEEVIKEIEEKWGSLVIAFVTDASGECRKARRELVKKYPWIVVSHIRYATHRNYWQIK
jgi:hypothetical protein